MRSSDECHRPAIALNCSVVNDPQATFDVGDTGLEPLYHSHAVKRLAFPSAITHSCHFFYIPVLRRIVIRGSCPIARIYSASRDVRSECMHLTEKCSERAGNDREAVHRCYHELQMCLQRNGRSLAAR
jgi:hypothetical protein